MPRIPVPIPVPRWMYSALRSYYRSTRARSDEGRINLIGDRDIEWTWVAANIPTGPGKALDFGPGGSALGLLAAQRGFDVVALDQEQIRWPYVHPNLRFVWGDVRTAILDTGSFDLVINCSTVEHVGLAGRYGVTSDDTDGDLIAMRRLHALMRPGGTMLLTVPVGRDTVFPPLTRVYGRERLPRLTEGYADEGGAYWIKDEKNRWVECDRETAVAFEPSATSWNPEKNAYALGCRILRKREER